MEEPGGLHTVRRVAKSQTWLSDRACAPLRRSILGLRGLLAAKLVKLEGRPSARGPAAEFSKVICFT